jgi:small subunit ribosomal protein S24e
MELELKKERETPLLSRKRLTFDITFKGTTPSRNDIREKIADKVKANKDLTIIRHVYTKYGAEQAKVIAHVYNKKEDLDRIEDKKTLKKHAPKVEKTEGVN